MKLFRTAGVLAHILLATICPASPHIQIVHNCADPSLQTLDVWINNSQLINDVKFRSATPYTEVSGTGTVTIGFALASSASADECLVRFDIAVANNERMVVVLNGVGSPDNFLPNPDGAGTELSLTTVHNIPEPGTESSATLGVVHGTADAPSFDIRISGMGLIPALGYTAVSPLRPAKADNHVLTISPTGSQPQFAYTADLSDYDGTCALVVISGFLSPQFNQNGPAMGLFLVPPAGGDLAVLPLTAVQATAAVQIIHNSPDTTLGVVDIYAAGQLIADDLPFRNATGFLDLAAASDVPFAIAPASSTSVAQAVAIFNVSITEGRHVLILNGIVDTTGVQPNPDHRAAGISLSLDHVSGIREVAQSPGTVDIVFAHGVIDAPAVDFKIESILNAKDIYYRTFSDYLSAEATSTRVALLSTGGHPLTSGTANLGLLSGSAVVFVYSGIERLAFTPYDAALLVAIPAGGKLLQLGELTDVREHAANTPIGFSISPNPASTRTRITFSERGYARHSSVRIICANGAEVPTPIRWLSDTEAEIDLHHQSAGAYMVLIQDVEKMAAMKLLILP